MNIRKITGIGLLVAVAIVLTLFSNNVTFGAININLSLIPIALGAIIYGPFAGAIIGLVNGIFTLFAPTTIDLYALNVASTVIAALVKTSVAGLVSGLLYNLISKKNKTVAIVIASLIVPVVNTVLFIAIATPFYGLGIKDIIGILVSFNFLIEFASTAFLCPVIIKIISLVKEKRVK